MPSSQTANLGVEKIGSGEQAGTWGTTTNLNLDIIDEGIYISDKDAFARVDELLRKEGILAGTSCGTLVDAAIKWCQKQTEPKKVVTLICDTGNKYLSKAFNKDWLKENELID